MRDIDGITRCEEAILNVLFSFFSFLTVSRIITRYCIAVSVLAVKSVAEDRRNWDVLHRQVPGSQALALDTGANFPRRRVSVGFLVGSERVRAEIVRGVPIGLSFCLGRYSVGWVGD